jgi:predicted DNA-binding transcriptional regulator AlpA
MMERLLLSTEDAAEALSLSRSAFYSLHSAGKVGPLPIKLNRRTLWSVRELDRWIDAGCPCRSEWQKAKETDNLSVVRQS